MAQDTVGTIKPTPKSSQGVVKIDDQVVTTTEEVVEETMDSSIPDNPNRKPSSEALIRMIEKIDIERIDITDLIVVVALSVALIYSIYMKMMELSMSIGSGLLGYIGGVTKRDDSVKTHRTDTMTTTTAHSAPSSAEDTKQDPNIKLAACRPGR